MLWGGTGSNLQSGARNEVKGERVEEALGSPHRTRTYVRRF